MKWNIIKCPRSWVAVARLVIWPEILPRSRLGWSWVSVWIWLSLKLIAYQVRRILSTGFGHPSDQPSSQPSLSHSVFAYLRLCGIFKWRFFALANSMRASILPLAKGASKGGTKRGPPWQNVRWFLIILHVATMFAIVENLAGHVCLSAAFRHFDIETLNHNFVKDTRHAGRQQGHT